ncbi:MAG: twin-arginine translocase subunit TatC [Actinomycetota bacterium]|nr:twin-arginine translocase subunit TatC [Actinomycetota bacterium]
MPKVKVKPVQHEDEVSLVDHLDELRTRIITSLFVFGVALALCFWQNHMLLDIANGPLPGGREPITFGIAEPFTTTLTVSAYGAILLSLPILLYQAYAFMLPALKPTEKSAVMPFLLMAPFLFISGVVFAYFVVLPAATEFLLNFNEDQFNIEIRAREYYSFFAMALISVGVLFQIPTGILAVTRLGIVTPKQIAANRRYAVLIIAVAAMLLPGTDPVTMLISMAPLIVLFEGSLLLARVLPEPKDRSAETPDAPPAGA